MGTCNPSPCTPGTLPSWPSTAVVNLGPVSDGANTDTRYYAYYVPRNLVTTDPSHPPAAVFFTAGGGADTAQSVLTTNAALQRSGLQPLADANSFVVILLLPPVTGASHTGWNHPETDCGGAGGVAGGGTSNLGTSPSDAPYIAAAVSAATVQFNIDPERRYVVGGSSGADAARETICDARTASLFRGAATLGGGANARYKTTGPGSCPSGVKTKFYLEVMGKATQQDPYNTIDLASGDHTILGFDDTRNWWSSYMGCSAPVHSTIGSGVLSDVYDYTCPHASSPQFEAVAMTNGGHTWCNLDTTPASACGVGSNNTGGWKTATWVWRFFANTTTAS